MNKKRQRDMLQTLFDDTTSADEKARLKNELLQGGASKLYHSLTLMEKHRKERAERTFQPHFQLRVMKRIRALKKSGTPDFISSLEYMFRRFIVAGLVAVVLLVAAQWISGNGLYQSSDPYANQSIDDIMVETFTPSLEDLL